MIEIRRALAKDSQAIAQIGIRVWEEFVSSWNKDVDHIREHIHGVFRDGSDSYWDRILVATLDGAVVGWISREELDFRVSYLCVDPDHGDKGVATALLRALEKQIRSEGFSHAEMDFHARSTSAIAFFMKYSATLLDSTEKLTMRKDFTEFEEADTTVTAMEAN
jgi:ribosomal protein S18 acetylase RimI-like enzyme